MQMENSDKQLFSKLLREQVEAFDIELTETQIQQFYRYFELLTEWNSVMNLTAITKMEEVVTKHFVDSLSIVKIVPEFGKKPCSLIDVGTGAGFPGIPLKIAFPKVKVVLLDSLNKRIKFLNEVISQLELTEITAIHGRAEDWGRDKQYREKFDYCVSRAVANLSTLSEYCIPFVKVGGSFIPYKSGKVEEEMLTAKKAVQILGGEVVQEEEFILPKADASRILVKIDKKKTLSSKYPRKAGTPSKEPLGGA